MKKRKDRAAAAMGRKGGKARALSLTPERRSEIASMGAKAKHARTKRFKRTA